MVAGRGWVGRGRVDAPHVLTWGDEQGRWAGGCCRRLVSLECVVTIRSGMLWWERKVGIFFHQMFTLYSLNILQIIPQWSWKKGGKHGGAGERAGVQGSLRLPDPAGPLGLCLLWVNMALPVFKLEKTKPRLGSLFLNSGRETCVWLWAAEEGCLQSGKGEWGD